MEKIQDNSINFIETILIPEMVDNRCFCASGSREFVELDSVNVIPWQTTSINNNRELYKTRVVIKFSGEPETFHVIIKLLSLHAQDNDIAYGRFLNEEMFYSKITAKYKLNIYPKCYVADMGRYGGRPVIVLEDLTAINYQPVITKLDNKQMKIYLKVITKFISRGLDLKRDEFEIFREFYSKLIQTRLNGNHQHIELINEYVTFITIYHL